MADVTVVGSPGPSDSISLPSDGLVFAGAGSTWAGQHDLGGVASDDLVFTPPIRGVSAGTAGTLHFEYASGREVTINLDAGFSNRFLAQIRRIFADSTAVDIHVQW